MLSVLANFIFFTPKRPVDIELFEPTDLPREAGRNAINEYLERFYNQDAPPNTYVPYTVWEETQQMTLPEPEPVKLVGSAEEVPESTRQIVRGYLRELTVQQNRRTKIGPRTIWAWTAWPARTCWCGWKRSSAFPAATSTACRASAT